MFITNALLINLRIPKDNIVHPSCLENWMTTLGNTFGYKFSIHVYTYNGNVPLINSLITLTCDLNLCIDGYNQGIYEAM